MNKYRPMWLKGAILISDFMVWLFLACIDCDVWDAHYVASVREADNVAGEMLDIIIKNAEFWCDVAYCVAFGLAALLLTVIFSKHVKTPSFRKTRRIVNIVGASVFLLSGLLGLYDNYFLYLGNF